MNRKLELTEEMFLTRINWSIIMKRIKYLCELLILGLIVFCFEFITGIWGTLIPWFLLGFIIISAGVLIFCAARKKHIIFPICILEFILLIFTVFMLSVSLFYFFNVPNGGILIINISIELFFILINVLLILKNIKRIVKSEYTNDD
ncbi:MAG: hypothetical protein J5857_03230 [Treponema sp.]|nr:hypothetical protein [Treponema sp.]